MSRTSKGPPQVTMQWLRIVTKHIDELQDAGLTIEPQYADRVDAFCVAVDGPPDTPYSGARFKAFINLPEAYPASSPSVGFVEHVPWHPNIDFRSGSICLNVIGEAWSRATTLRAVVQDLLPMLLACPNPGDPLNHAAAVELMDSEGQLVPGSRFWVHAHKVASRAPRTPQPTPAAPDAPPPTAPDAPPPAAPDAPPPAAAPSTEPHATPRLLSESAASPADRGVSSGGAAPSVAANVTPPS